MILSAPASATAPVAVYVAGLVALFSISALYHKPSWSTPARLRLRRLDHATIFVFIAATYTPVCLLALGNGTGHQMLTAVWVAAGTGVLKSVFWPGAPRLLSACLYIAMGWIVITGFSSLPAALGGVNLALLGAGGLLYTLGALFYAFKWPEPCPRVFGYHEVFHAMVIAAAACHFVVIRNIVLAQ